MSRRLAELRLPQLRELITEDSVLLFPVGAIEQHGPHLPFTTDLEIPTRAAQALADRHGEELDLWLLEPLAVTKSNEHHWAPGTVWISARTLLSVIEDIARSLETLPTRTLVFLNGHGGNSSLLNVACRELRVQGGWNTFLMHPMVPPDQGGESAASEAGMGIHGGHLETSLMLHLAPDLVDMNLATRNVPDDLTENEHVRFGGSVTFGWTSDDFGPDGHIGDPTGASAEVGERAFEDTIASLANAIREVRAFRDRSG